MRMRPALVVWFAAVAGCSSSGAPPVEHSHPPPASDKVPIDMTPALSPNLEAELATIRRDPAESVGFGDKAYVPYIPNSAPRLIASPDPQVTERLAAEARKPGDRVYRLAIVHVLGYRTDATVDDALIGLLGDPALCATAAYQLGRAGFKGYPRRSRDVHAVQAALQPHLDDGSTFADPFYRRTFRTQDFVLGAFVRVAGLERFHIPNTELADLIGLGLPEFGDAERAELLTQARAIR